MNGQTPTVYMPIESRARELDARLLLASRLIERGLTVVIGQQWLMRRNLEAYPRGLVLLKGLDRVQTQNMALLRRWGFLTAACDEEALGLAEADYMARDVCPSVHEAADLMITQGPYHREVVCRRTGCPADRVASLGNVRLDFLRPGFRALYAEERAAAEAAHGSFVLFNTNTGFVHTAWRDLAAHEDVLRNTGWLDDADPRSHELHRQAVALDHLNFDLTRRTVRGLAERNPDLVIVVRPHPAERVGAWEGEFPDLANVTVSRERGHLAMMLAARLVLHTGCTTGLEAMLLGVPVLSIKPEGRDGAAAAGDDGGDGEFGEGAWRSFVSNHLNPLATGADDAIRRAEGALAGTLDLEADRPEERAAARARHFVGLDGDLVADAVAAALVDLMRRKGVADGPAPWAPLTLKNLYRAVSRDDYQKRKMSLTHAELAARYRDILRLAGRPVPTRVREIGDSLFVMSQAA